MELLFGFGLGSRGRYINSGRVMRLFLGLAKKRANTLQADANDETAEDSRQGIGKHTVLLNLTIKMSV